MFANNIEGSWYVKEVGEDKYQEELKAHLKKSKTMELEFLVLLFLELIMIKKRISKKQLISVKMQKLIFQHLAH